MFPSSDIDQLLHVRTTFTRLRDSRIQHGWIEHVDSREIHVRISESARFLSGDTYVFEVYGLEQTATFIAVWKDLWKPSPSGVYDGGCPLATFSILTPLGRRNPEPSARRRFSQVYGFLSDDQAEHDVRLLDGSRRGVGLMIWKPPHDGLVRLRVSAFRGTEFEMEVRLRNQRLLVEAQNQFRAGFEIVRFDRVSQRRWLGLTDRRSLVA